MRLRTFHPTRSTYAPADTVELRAEVDDHGDGATLEVVVSHLDRAVAKLETTLTGTVATVSWKPLDRVPAGYGVDATLRATDGVVVDTAHSAFDVLRSWTDRPRYGFMSDFPADRDDIHHAIEQLSRFHINALQFYDWQYRHDQLVAPTTRYDDPLGRELSLETITAALGAARRHGIATMAYVAVYAASVELWRQRPGWALYDDEGEPVRFGDDFLGLMDPTAGRPWAEHLLDQCGSALDEVGFDGVHIDQYGEPRQGWDAAGQEVDLPVAFSQFITSLKQRRPDVPTTFNAVKNWPIDQLVQAPQDFAYIELWPDTPRYTDLRDVVAHANATSGRPVVIALYLPADRPENILLADALLLAHGGTRIELGEGLRLLTDPYFPNHQPLPQRLEEALHRYYDFAVRYGDLLHQPPDNGDVHTDQSDIWTTTRHYRSNVSVCLVNMAGLTDARWDQAHRTPQARADLQLDIGITGRVVDVWIASPDDPSPEPRSLDFALDDGRVHVRLPHLERLALLHVQLDHEDTP